MAKNFWNFHTVFQSKTRSPDIFMKKWWQFTSKILNFALYSFLLLPNSVNSSKLRQICKHLWIFAFFLGWKLPKITTFQKCWKSCFRSFSKLISLNTVWKFQDFCVIQILREINFGESRSSKMAILAIFGALNSVNLVNLCLSRASKCLKLDFT